MTRGVNNDLEFAKLAREEMHPRGGCQCKIPACELESLLRNAYSMAYGNQRVPTPMEAPFDCAIVNIENPQILFCNDFSPIVGIDPQAAGRIAALHSFNDIYASGGVPRCALVTLIVNRSYTTDFTEHLMAAILQTVDQEGAAVVGGQTIEGPEAMVGLSVMGVPRAGRLLRKLGGQTGDALLLSKPLGVGMVVQGFKLLLIGEQELNQAITIMTESNARMSVHALEHQASAATDVTGFGLLGHLVQMLQPQQGALIELPRIPILPAAASLQRQLIPTRWSKGNMEYARSKRPIRGAEDSGALLPLLDPQTNGGLLVAASEDSSLALEQCGFFRIGQITDRAEIELIT